MVTKKPAKQKKAKDLEISKARGGEKVKGGATSIKIDARALADKHYR
jgi:hypothetical protein